MTTTTDLLRRAAKHAYAHALRLAAIGLDEKKSMVEQDAESLIALADQMERSEPVGTVRTCVWNGQGWTVSLIVPIKMRVGDPLYANPAPEVTRDAENLKLREALQRLLTAATPFYTTINRNSDLSAAIFNASSILTWASYAAMQEPKP